MTARPDVPDTPDRCRYMVAAYPDLADSCDFGHRHEPRVFALAEALATAVHEGPPSDEQVAWFLDDADAVVDDFDPTPETWTATPFEFTEESGLDGTLTINGRPYVLQESDWEPAHPVARATYDSWTAAEEDD